MCLSRYYIPPYCATVCNNHTVVCFQLNAAPGELDTSATQQGQKSNLIPLCMLIVTTFEALQHRTSVKDVAHIHWIDA